MCDPEAWSTREVAIGILQLSKFVVAKPSTGFARDSRKPRWLADWESVGRPCGRGGVPTGVPSTLGDAGVLVDPYDAEQISRALAELLENPGRREELSRRGLERARRFTWPQVADQTVRVYKQILCGS